MTLEPGKVCLLDTVRFSQQAMSVAYGMKLKLILINAPETLQVVYFKGRAEVKCRGGALWIQGYRHLHTLLLAHTH